MPILMPTTFCPMENGDYMLLGQDHGENHKEIARHSKHDADAYDAFNHDVNKVLQAIKPLLDQVPPDIFSDDPEELIALAALGSRFRKLDKKVVHDAVRLLTGSAADFLDDYFESDIIKGYMASSAIIGTKVGPYSQGSGLVLLYHILGEHDGEFGAWAFHKRGNGGFTQVLARAAESFGVEIRLESPVERVITRDGQATGVALVDGTEFHAPIVVSALDPGGPSSSSSSLASCRPTSSRTSSDFASRGPHRRSTSPSTACRAIRPSAIGQTSTAASPTSGRRWSTSSGPMTTRSTAGTRSGRTSTAPIQSMVDPDMAPPGKAVMSCFIQYTPYQLRESDWDTEREHMADNVQATLESFFPGFGDLVLQREDPDAARHRADRRAVGGQHLRRRVPRSPDVLLPARAGLVAIPDPIDGYYQCGSGTHPGGCVMGAPGKLAAGQIIKDRARATA